MGESQPLLFPELGNDIPMADDRSSEGELERTVVPNPEVVGPPNVESAPEERVESAVSQDSAASGTVRRKPGRPRKYPPKVKASGSQVVSAWEASTSRHSDTVGEDSRAEPSKPKRSRPSKESIATE